MTDRVSWRTPAAAMLTVILVLVATSSRPAAANLTAPEAIVYTMRFPSPESHVAEIEARIPTEGRATIDLMLPVWSPGYYAHEDYARNVQGFAARAAQGAALEVDKPAPNHWLVSTGGASSIVITYKLLCTRSFVTGCWVDPAYAVINGPSTFITIHEPHQQTKRPYEVVLELAPAWPRSISSLDTVDGNPNHYRGADYDVFIDSPIVAGPMSVHEFDVAGTTHHLADFGDRGAWDGAAAAAALQRIVEEHQRFLGGLPFAKYVFLNWFRRGAGGLEHLNSSLLASTERPTDPLPTLRWLKFVSHEYFHAVNVKRLRPVELGPFDYEQLPSTPSLWIAEGLTSYYGNLAVVRSGVGSREDFLAGLSNSIRTVQTSPGRLVQTLEQASLTAGTTSTSGIGGNRDESISYYDKGPVVGWLIDARIRRVTNDARSLDDVMRAAIAKYSGERGYRPEEFLALASEVAGVDLRPLFHATLATTEELDYTEALAWFGLRFAEPGSADPVRAWALEPSPDATEAQRQHLARLLSSTTR